MNENQQRGIGITSILGIVFIVLKLAAVIDWPWWWILAPFWMPPLVVMTIALLPVLGILTMFIFQSRKGNQR